MQKSKIGKFSIFNSLDVKLKFLMSWIELTQFSVESSRAKLKIWAIQLELSWKCEQFDSISIQIQNVNLKFNSMISLYVFEDILSQYDENEILHSVAYFSKKHNSVECNYEIYDKEFMIIVCTFKKWWSELEYFIYFIKIIMNHKNLKYFMSIKQLSHHQARWSEFLSRFNYCIAYCFNKIDDKLNALTCHSEDFFKKRDTFNSQHQYQH